MTGRSGNGTPLRVDQQLVIPTTFDPAFVEGLSALNGEAPAGALRVGEVYGSFQTSATGSARPSKYLPGPSDAQLAAHIAALHAVDVDFAYLMNAPCLGNTEYTPRGRAEIVDLVDRVVDLGVDSVVVTLPYLMELIRERHPGLGVTASSICYIRSVREAQGFAALGCRRLIVDPDITRDFALLRRIAAAVPECELEIIANHFCLQGCHYEPAHYASTGHASQTADPGHVAIYSGYHLLKCNLQKLEDPTEFLRAPWVAPADVHRYGSVPVQWIKLAGRGGSREQILDTARAYITRQAGPNLLPLLGWAHWQLYARDRSGHALPPLEFRLDPEKLGPGFFDFFERRPPGGADCTRCTHCAATAARALTYDAGLRDQYVANMRRELQTMLTTTPTAEEHATAVADWERRAADCAACTGC